VASDVKPESVQRLQAEFLYRHAYSAPGLNIFSSVAVAGAQIFVFNEWHLLEWCIGMILINLARIYLGMRYHNRAEDDNNDRRWIQLYLGPFWVTGAWWGASVWLLTAASPEVHFTTLFAVAAVVSGAMPMISVLRNAYHFYVVITLGQYAVCYALMGEQLYYTLAAFIVFFAGGLVMLSRNLYQTYSEMIRLRIAEQANARHDVLTGVPNRRAFEEVLQEEWKHAQRGQYPLSVVFVDVDEFKYYNDHFGHLAGDECLKLAAHGLRQALKRETDVFARFGGEEFVAILPMTDPQDGQAIAERLRETIETLQIPHAPSSPRKYITVSLGGASCVPDGHLLKDELLQAADKCLYASKNAGRNQTRWTIVKPRIDSVTGETLQTQGAGC
jgi:diguanylate cyclase (GGDEF)-like protein